MCLYLEAVITYQKYAAISLLFASTLSPCFVYQTDIFTIHSSYQHCFASVTGRVFFSSSLGAHQSMQTIRRIMTSTAAAIDPSVDVKQGIRVVLDQVEKAFDARPAVSRSVYNP